MCGDVLLMCLASFFDVLRDVHICCHKFDVLFDVLGISRRGQIVVKGLKVVVLPATLVICT